MTKSFIFVAEGTYSHPPQFSFTKNFSAYTDATYLGGGDVDQNWGANLGVKYTWK
ncbi:TPA: autotransporter outer membrane beta-barrel domain-containing protein [Enterobacter asburiae]|nr:autotransporter outer membrane beta-barrel domain-containing protein [Enterobacter asburiae]